MAKVTAVSTLGWANYTLYEALPRIAARGFKTVEICSFGTYCFHFNFGNPTPQELKEMLAQYGLAPVMLHFCGGRHNAWDRRHAQETIELWKRKLEHLSVLGIKQMSMVFGERNNRPDQEAQLAAEVRVYDEIAETARQYGVRMVIEVPHVYTVMPSPQQVYWVLDHLESDNVGVLLEATEWCVIKYDLDEYLDRIGERLWHVHLRDARGADTADRMQQLEFTPGRGEVDFTKLAASLDRVGYRGGVSLEFEYRDMTFDAIEKEFDHGLKHLQKCGWEIPQGVRIG